jgi:predicted RNA-binding Zn-ribbon protein involved in translation (DUF1610 family)
VTARFDEETRQLLRDSIKEIGIISPVLVQLIGEDLVLVDGLHRLQDSIAAGDAPIDVAVLEGDMADLLCRNLFLDHARGKTPVSEMVQVIGLLYTEHHLDPDKIKERTGLSRDYIERLIKISTASPAVQDALDQGVIGVGHAYEIARLPYAIQQDELIGKHQVYRFSVRDLHDQIDAVLREMENLKAAPPPAPTGAQRPPPTYHCEGCKSEIEPRYLRPVMVCPECFGELWRLAKTRPASSPPPPTSTAPL